MNETIVNATVTIEETTIEVTSVIEEVVFSGDVTVEDFQLAFTFSEPALTVAQSEKLDSIQFGATVNRPDELTDTLFQPVENGKGLSQEDFTTGYRQKLDELSAFDPTLLANKVDKVTGKALISESEITRLASVTNFDNSGNASTLAEHTTAIAEQATALANKVDKVDEHGVVPFQDKFFISELIRCLDGILP